MKTDEQIKAELGEDLCDYCPLTDYGKVRINTGPWNLCEGIRCDDALSNYKEQTEDE